MLVPLARPGKELRHLLLFCGSAIDDGLTRCYVRRRNGGIFLVIFGYLFISLVIYLVVAIV